MFQLNADVVRGLPALVRIFRQTCPDQLCESGWRERLDRGNRWWIGGQYSRDDRSLCFAGEGATSARHLVEHRAEREDIAALVGFFALKLLGRHVLERADDVSF